jgi:hypothetical protein
MILKSPNDFFCHLILTHFITIIIYDEPHFCSQSHALHLEFTPFYFSGSAMLIPAYPSEKAH